MEFNFELYTRVRFGEGVMNRLGQEAVELGVRRWMIVLDPGLARLGLAERVNSIMQASGLSCVFFDRVDREPDEEHVRAGVGLFHADECGGIIAIGGGSSIDAAKAIALMANNAEPIAQYEDHRTPRAPSTKLIAVPTTAGTGAEITLAAGIIDTQTNRKLVLVHKNLAPDVALVDPELTHSLPKSQTAHTGFDALTHALEAFVGNSANPVSDSLALDAVERIGHFLERAWVDGSDRRARSELMLGQLMAGMAVTNTGVALVHAMGRPLGVYFGVPHGLGNAMLLPLVTEFSVSKRRQRYDTVARLLPHNSPKPGDIVDKLRGMAAAMDVPTLSDLDLDVERVRALVPQMARDCLNSPSTANNPRVPTQEEVEQLYAGLLS